MYLQAADRVVAPGCSSSLAPSVVPFADAEPLVRSSAIAPAQVSFAGAAGPSVNDVASENAPESCPESTMR